MANRVTGRGNPKNTVGSRLADLHLILPNEVPQLSC